MKNSFISIKILAIFLGWGASSLEAAFTPQPPQLNLNGGYKPFFNFVVFPKKERSAELTPLNPTLFQFEIEVPFSSFQKIGVLGGLEAGKTKASNQNLKYHFANFIGSYYKVYYPVSDGFSCFARTDAALVSFSFGFGGLADKLSGQQEQPGFQGYGGVGLNLALHGGMEVFFNKFWGLTLSGGYGSLLGKEMLTASLASEDRASYVITYAPVVFLGLVSRY